jgi:hypothetical protein
MRARHWLGALLLAMGTHALAQVSCASRDPFTGACASGAGLAGAGAAVPARQGVADSSPATAGGNPFVPGLPSGVVRDGRRVCTQFDTRSPPGAPPRCLVWATSQSDYNSAVQTGIDAAMNGMAIIRDVQARTAGMGALGMGGMPALPVPAPSTAGVPAQGYGTPQQIPGGLAQSAQGLQFAECVKTRSAAITRQQGREPTPDETMTIIQHCDRP